MQTNRGQKPGGKRKNVTKSLEQKKKRKGAYGQRSADMNRFIAGLGLEPGIAPSALAMQLRKQDALSMRAIVGQGGSPQLKLLRKLAGSADKGKKSKLDGKTQQQMEGAFKEDFSGVDVYHDSPKAEIMGAEALTEGNEIHFASGKYDPGSKEGQELLGHELTHVVQQRAGVVQADEAGVNQHPQLEREADQAGRIVAKAGGLQGANAIRTGNGAASGPVVQMKLKFAAAKKKITGAEGFWGTDEKAVYDAILGVSAADRKRLKKDAAVQAFIKKYMSGHDLWKAQLLLEFGKRASWPAAVKDIWDATHGDGTDEDKIRNALEKLTAPQVAKIKAIPGLDKIIKSELSGADLKVTNQLLAGDYAKAIKRHKDNVQFAKNQVAAMKASASPLHKNTGLAVAPAAGTPIVKMHILSPTHDSMKRAKEHGKDNKGTRGAYFGMDVKFPSNTATYDSEISSKRGMNYATANTYGYHLKGTLSMFDPLRYSGPNWQNYVIHEAQHWLDRHNDEPDSKKAYKSVEESWSRYKTEFRAYWINNQFVGSSDAKGSATAPWDNARQKAIFDHMHVVGSGYDEWLRPLYKANTKYYGTGFKDLIHKYVRPEGVNLVNSPRINEFYDQLKKCKRSHKDASKSPLKELLAKATALDANDKTFINSDPAKPLQEMMKDHLNAAFFKTVATQIGGGALPNWAKVNIASARATITGAEGFWGTDEKKIYDTIEKASPKERKQMQTDPAIRKFLFSYMSGHDLWKALIMLEYGAKSSWPSAVTDVYDATKGDGTDEEKIRKALEKLTVAQAKKLAKVEGMMDMLKGDLSGYDLTNATELLSGDYAKAIGDRAADMKAISAVITSGLASPDAAWKAICMKISNRKKALIYALTPTHDTANRVKQAGKSGKTAWFGLDAPYPRTHSYYNSRKDVNTNIHFDSSGKLVHSSGKTLYIYNARKMSAAAIKSTLKNFGKHL